MMDLLDLNFNFYYENFLRWRNIEVNINLFDSSNVLKCGVCYEMILDMFYLGYGFNFRVSRVFFWMLLRREFWCENFIYEKDLNVNV